MHLFNRVQLTTSNDEWWTPASPRRQIEELLQASGAEEPLFRALEWLQEWRIRPLGCREMGRLSGSGTRAASRRGDRTSPAQWSSWTDFSLSFMTIICRFPGSHSSASGSSTISVARKNGPNTRCPGHAYGGVGGMYIRVISFGTNWWAMHSRDTNDPFCFRRKAAYFNAAGPYVGKASPSQRNLSRANSLQREERI